MNIKRITTVLLGFPLVALFLIFGNVHLIDLAFSIIAILALKEYFHAFSQKLKPVKWVRIFVLCIYCIYAYYTNGICT